MDGSDIELAAGMQVHQYELIRELGRGGMGQVWAARDTRLGRRVAMKFLIAASSEINERFLVEARATAQCSHENIVIIHQVDELEHMPYMVLEFLEGSSLRAVMGPYNGGTRLPPSRVVELTLPIARALARAHELRIVHRDLKPENVFVTKSGQVKVLDFGIAKALDGGPDRQAIAAAREGELTTQAGALLGTLPYMSPEQLGVDAIDHRSDLWSLGVMMWEMLVGRHPLDPLTMHELMLNASSDEPMPFVSLHVPDLPEPLVRIVDGCLRKRKAERFARADDVVARLEQLLPGRAGRALAEGESPYPGLSAFQESDANRFFGRDRDITRMIAMLREHPLTAVVGPSGVGKSSFVRAGVGPALKASGEDWDVVTLRPGRHPIAALASVVQRLTTQCGSTVQHQIAEHEDLMQRLRGEPGYLGSLLRGRAQQRQCRILLFVDQFEELYTLVADPGERRAFTASLAGVADDATTPLRVMVSMRADFIDRVADDPRFMDELSRGLVFLSAPDQTSMREALVQPVEMVNHHFESPAMVDDMLAALANIPGALPLLQFAAAKLWEARDRTRRLLTEASYRAIGGISGALATHADDVVAGMTATQQRLTRMVFRALVTPERTRAILELADLHQLSPDAEMPGVIDRLVTARLLVSQTRGETGNATVELVHESLIERWPTLRRWLEEDQEDAAFTAQLAAAAKQWEAKGKPGGLLWRGEAMEEARRWNAARPREIAPRDRAFLDAVLALAARGKRTRRIATVAAFVLLGLVAAGASLALVSVRGAEQTARAKAVEAQQALRERDDKDRLAREAEAQTQHVQSQKTAAEAQTKQVEEEKTAVEAQKAKAEARADTNGAELVVKNRKLGEALAAAQQAAAEAKVANAKLEAAHKIDRETIRAYEESKRHISTELK